jgi:hypothetical protein
LKRSWADKRTYISFSSSSSFSLTSPPSRRHRSLSLYFSFFLSFQYTATNMQLVFRRLSHECFFITKIELPFSRGGL